MRQNERIDSLPSDITDVAYCLIEVLFDDRGNPYDYRFLETDPMFEAHTGLAAARGRTIRELAPAHEPYWFRIYGEIARTGKPARFERPAAALGRTYNVYAFRVGPAEGNQVAVLFSDITERKRGESALRSANAKFEAVFNQSGIFAGIMDREGILLEANDLALSACGYARDEVLGRPFWATPWWRGSAEVQCRIRAATAQALGGQVFRQELRYWVADGTERIVDFAMHPVRDDAGTVMFLQPTGIDITERKRAEEALRHHAQQFQTLLDRAPIGVYLVDADLRILQVNPVAQPAFGGAAGRQGVSGRDFDDVIHLLWPREQADDIVRRFRHTLATGESYKNVEYIAPRIDLSGVLQYYEWRLDRIVLPDGRYGVVCYFRDISQQVQAREALRNAGRRKDEFLATLAHELRNPLAPIRTGLELIRIAGDSPQSVARIRGMMERQLGHMVRLIDDLLDVARITSDRIHLQKKPTRLGDMVHTAVEANRSAIEAAGIHLDVRLPETPSVIDVDPTRFVQVVSNLLHNAAKFTPRDGRIRIDASLISANGSRPELELIVSDTGDGIPPELLPHVFDLFTQGDRAARGAQAGLGIGLALARRLIELHGGRIEARSEGLGRGSAFVLHLPVTDDLALHEPESARLQPDVVTCRVVVIDDNHDAADTLARLVADVGGESHVAYDGESGIVRVMEFHPDVVFLDIGMPGLDGYETCRRIRRQVGSTPFVVAVTGWGQEGDRHRAEQAGFDAHLTKPADPRTIRRLLAQADRN